MTSLMARVPAAINPLNFNVSIVGFGTCMKGFLLACNGRCVSPI